MHLKYNLQGKNRCGHLDKNKQPKKMTGSEAEGAKRRERDVTERTGGLALFCGQDLAKSGQPPMAVFLWPIQHRTVLCKMLLAEYNNAV